MKNIMKKVSGLLLLAVLGLQVPFVSAGAIEDRALRRAERARQRSQSPVRQDRMGLDQRRFAGQFGDAIDEQTQAVMQAVNRKVAGIVNSAQALVGKADAMIKDAHAVQADFRAAADATEFKRAVEAINQRVRELMGAREQLKAMNVKFDEAAGNLDQLTRGQIEVLKSEEGNVRIATSRVNTLIGQLQQTLSTTDLSREFGVGASRSGSPVRRGSISGGSVRGNSDFE